MQTILIVDDDPAYHDILTEAIQEQIAGTVCTCEVDFDVAIKRIATERPDAVILDLMEGVQSPNLPGERTWKSMWDQRFCPLVIYSGAEADLEPPVPEANPFIERITKGDGSVPKVIESLKRLAPAASSIRQLRSEVDAVIHKVLRDTAGEGHISLDDPAYLLHAGRRRIAAAMDDPTITGQRKMASWEQYLVPAIGDSPLTADLLRSRGAKWDDPTAYRLVLTPSCDLVKGRCEPTLIAACCEGAERLARKLSLSMEPKKLASDTKTVIIKALSVGTYSGLLPLPGFPSRLPVMVANLKKLEVIFWTSIGPADSSAPGFDRIASIDSPFREQVAWAYLTTAARPGMPDRDMEPWAEELVKAATPPPPPQAGNAAAGT